MTSRSSYSQTFNVQYHHSNQEKLLHRGHTHDLPAKPDPNTHQNPSHFEPSTTPRCNIPYPHSESGTHQSTLQNTKRFRMLGMRETPTTITIPQLTISMKHIETRLHIIPSQIRNIFTKNLNILKDSPHKSHISEIHQQKSIPDRFFGMIKSTSNTMISAIADASTRPDRSVKIISVNA